MELTGTVIRVNRKNCLVDVEGKKYKAYIPRKVQMAHQNEAKAVTVGDEIVFEIRKSREIWVKKILSRESWLARSAVGRDKEQIIVSNVHQLAIICSIFAPPFRSGLIDRFLIAALKGNIEPFIIVNKIDLQDQEEKWSEIKDMLEVYEKQGHCVIYTSTVSMIGLDELKQKLQEKRTVLSGHSGVGKSSLLSSIDSHLNLKIQDVGAKSRRGQHTTTNVTLYPLEFGGYVVDTPGIREFSLWEIDPADLSLYYSDFSEYAPLCKYHRCTHIHEPDCKVKKGVHEGKIAEFRYKNYCNILESLQNPDKARNI